MSIIQTPDPPCVAVIIPTHNRQVLLEVILQALTRQDYGLDDLEVVVVADGCKDGTLAMLEGYRSALRLRVIEQPGSGAANARNTGAAATSAGLLIFLDDDVEPMPSFVTAHVEAHRQAPGGFVVGPYPPVPHATRSPFALNVRRWWHEQFVAINRPWHRFNYRNMLTGNLSVSAALWRRIGGLDVSFRAAGGEDYELGMRLIKAGIPITFAPEARALHHEHQTMTLAASFRRAMVEGRAHVLLARKHPEIRWDFKFAHLPWRSRPGRLADAALFGTRGRLDRAAHAVARLLPVLERFGLRRAYRRIYGRLHHYWYVRGVSEAFPSYRAWRLYALAADSPRQEPAFAIDLREGIPAAEAYLDRMRPASIRLRYGNIEIGHLPANKGAEPWRGRHLRGFIIEYLADEYFQILTADNLWDDIVPPDLPSNPQSDSVNWSTCSGHLHQADRSGKGSVHEQGNATSVHSGFQGGGSGFGGGAALHDCGDGAGAGN